MKSSRRLAAFALSLLAGMAQPAAALSLPDWLRLGAEAQPAAAPRPVVTEIVEGHDANKRWIPGTVRARTQVSMAFQVLGRMVARHVDIGDRVEAGDLLAELATDDMAATTRAARAALEAAEVQAATVRTTLERTVALAQRDVASAAQLEEAQSMMAAAEAAVEQTRSQLVQAQDAESHARMIAPFDAVVSAVYITPGAVVGAGEPVLQLSADDGREAVIDLPETALTGLARDAVFTVWQRSSPEIEAIAVLDRIEPLADHATRTRRLYLTLPQSAPFRLGALIRTHPGTASKPVLTLPAQAVRELDGQPHVWRVIRNEDQAHVEAAPVVLGASYQGRVTVQQGIVPGDEIVVRGVGVLQQGQAVGRRMEP